MKFSIAKVKFLNWLEIIKAKSPKTVEQYNRHLEKFEIYIKSSDFEVEDIDLDIAE
jgi:site-specific recombinase XerD